ncbi:MAG TPA: hypothetical protein QF353_02250 [Gammaproteobacteria bacterium]|nr:hypothetical protein [Gammaproteobacteria bacterium]
MPRSDLIEADLVHPNEWPLVSKLKKIDDSLSELRSLLQDNETIKRATDNLQNNLFSILATQKKPFRYLSESFSEEVITKINILSENLEDILTKSIDHHDIFTYISPEKQHQLTHLMIDRALITFADNQTTYYCTNSEWLNNLVKSPLSYNNILSLCPYQDSQIESIISKFDGAKNTPKIKVSPSVRLIYMGKPLQETYQLHPELANLTTNEVTDIIDTPLIEKILSYDFDFESLEPRERDFFIRAISNIIAFGDHYNIEFYTPALEKITQFLYRQVEKDIRDFQHLSQDNTDLQNATDNFQNNIFGSLALFSLSRKAQHKMRSKDPSINIDPSTYLTEQAAIKLKSISDNLEKIMVRSIDLPEIITLLSSEQKQKLTKLMIDKTLEAFRLGPFNAYIINKQWFTHLLRSGLLSDNILVLCPSQDIQINAVTDHIERDTKTIIMKKPPTINVTIFDIILLLIFEGPSKDRNYELNPALKNLNNDTVHQIMTSPIIHNILHYNFQFEALSNRERSFFIRAITNIISFANSYNTNIQTPALANITRYLCSQIEESRGSSSQYFNDMDLQDYFINTNLLKILNSKPQISDLNQKESMSLKNSAMYGFLPILCDVTEDTTYGYNHDVITTTTQADVGVMKDENVLFFNINPETLIHFLKMSIKGSSSYQAQDYNDVFNILKYSLKQRLRSHTTVSQLKPTTWAFLIATDFQQSWPLDWTPDGIATFMSEDRALENYDKTEVYNILEPILNHSPEKTAYHPQTASLTHTVSFHEYCRTLDKIKKRIRTFATDSNIATEDDLYPKARPYLSISDRITDFISKSQYQRYACINQGPNQSMSSSIFYALLYFIVEYCLPAFNTTFDRKKLTEFYQNLTAPWDNMPHGKLNLLILTSIITLYLASYNYIILGTAMTIHAYLFFKNIQPYNIGMIVLLALPLFIPVSYVFYSPVIFTWGLLSLASIAVMPEAVDRLLENYLNSIPLMTLIATPILIIIFISTFGAPTIELLGHEALIIMTTINYVNYILTPINTIISLNMFAFLGKNVFDHAPTTYPSFTDFQGYLKSMNLYASTVLKPFTLSQDNKAAPENENNNSTNPNPVE